MSVYFTCLDIKNNYSIEYKDKLSKCVKVFLINMEMYAARWSEI